jgi:hypothetical protein
VHAAPQQGHQGRAFGAAIPALGLSNKAVFEDDAGDANNAGAQREGGEVCKGPYTPSGHH